MRNVIGCNEADTTVRGVGLTLLTPNPHKVHQSWRWIPWNVLMAAVATGFDHEITSLCMTDYQGAGAREPRLIGNR